MGFLQEVGGESQVILLMLPAASVHRSAAVPKLAWLGS
jgi:hypothetical protein